MRDSRYKERYLDCLNIMSQLHADPGRTCIRTEQLSAAHERYMLDIIIPAYNVQNYIEACIRSVLTQRTDYPYRIILVDDGSWDRTPELVDQYKTHKDICVIHQKNRGLSGARNTGLLQTDARYVMFLDSDDCLSKDAVQKLLTTAESNAADIVSGSYCNFKRFYSIHRNHYQKSGVLSSTLDLAGHAWGKVYRRKLFERVMFPEGYWFEDSLMHQIIFPNAESYVGIRDVLYRRRSNPSSITKNAAGNPKSLDSIWVTLRLMEDREQLKMVNDKDYCSYMLSQISLNHIRLRGMPDDIRDAAFTAVAICMNDLFQDINYYDLSNYSPVYHKAVKAIEALDYHSFSSLHD